MRIFGSVELQSESNFPFLYIIKFQTYWFSGSLAPLMGEIDIRARGLFYMKFNSEQLLFEDFFKHFNFGNIIIHKNGKVDSVSGSMLPKLRITSKKVWNKSCSVLNFVQKSPRTHMSIYPWSGGRGSKDSHLWNIILYKNGKVDSPLNTTEVKIRWGGCKNKKKLAAA